MSASDGTDTETESVDEDVLYGSDGEEEQRVRTGSKGGELGEVQGR